jgi:hypothetical protein
LRNKLIIKMLFFNAIFSYSSSKFGRTYRKAIRTRVIE